MSDSLLSAEEIKLKVNKLLRLYLENKELNNKLLKDNENLKKLLENQKNIIESLEERNKILKLADGIQLSGGDVHEIKLKINEYIREIDECIRLLSD